MRREVQFTPSLLRIGTDSVPSHVLFVISPALSHTVENPDAEEAGTGRICRSMTALECVMFSPTLLKNSRSVPSSSSLLISGLREPVSELIRVQGPTSSDRVGLVLCAEPRTLSGSPLAKREA